MALRKTADLFSCEEEGRERGGLSYQAALRGMGDRAASALYLFLQPALPMSPDGAHRGAEGYTP